MIFVYPCSQPIQDRTWHLVLTSPQVPLGCDSFSDFHVRGDLDNVRGDLDRVRGDLDHVRGDLDHVRGDLDHVRGDLDRVRFEEGTGQVFCRMSHI